MYLLKHLPPHLQKRWETQLALQHDVDIKRLWRRAPQTMDSMVGSPPISVEMEFPDEVYPSSSGASSSSDSSASPPPSSSTGFSCRDCITLTVSGHTGDEAVLNGTWDLELAVLCDDSSYITYNNHDSGDPDVVQATYFALEQRWGVYLQNHPPTVQAAYTSGTGETIDFEGSLEFESGTGSAGTATISSGCASSSAGSGSGSAPGSSSDASSSDPGSSSGGSSSSAASSGGGSGSAPDDSSSSFGSAGYSWDGSASWGEVSSGSNSYADPDCDLICAVWVWQGAGWRRTIYNLTACPVTCTGNCEKRPEQSGYVGLYADVHCDGDIVYYENP